MFKKSILFVSLFMSSYGLAAERVLLECSQKFASLKVTHSEESGEVSVERTKSDRGLLYFEENAEKTELRQVLSGTTIQKLRVNFIEAQAELAGDHLDILVADQDSTKVVVFLEPATGKDDSMKIVKFTSENTKLLEALLKGLEVERNDELTYMASACHLGGS